MPRLIACLLAFGCVCAAACVSAHADEYQITAAEKAACTPDAERLCLATYPDEGKLMTCLKANRKALSPVCVAAFDAGMKRRGLR